MDLPIRQKMYTLSIFSRIYCILLTSSHEDEHDGVWGHGRWSNAFIPKLRWCNEPLLPSSNGTATGMLSLPFEEPFFISTSWIIICTRFLFQQVKAGSFSSRTIFAKSYWNVPKVSVLDHLLALASPRKYKDTILLFLWSLTFQRERDLVHGPLWSIKRSKPLTEGRMRFDESKVCL